MPGKSTGADLHINKPLSNMAIKYRPEGMIADLILPTVNVGNKSDSYYVWNIADVFRTVEDRVAAGEEAHKITRSISSDTYNCIKRALKGSLLYEDIANADAKEIFGSRSAEAEAVMDKLAINKEVRVGQQVMNTSNVGSSTTTASAWNTAGAGNDPIGDIDTAMNNVELLTGYRPNSILFGQDAWLSFARNSDVISAVFGDSAVGTARVPAAKNVKALFDVENVLIGRGVYNTADENQSASLSRIYADHVLLYYVPKSANKMKPSFGYTFNWAAVKGYNMQVRVFDKPVADTEEVQVGYYEDSKITAANLAFLITYVNCSQ